MPATLLEYQPFCGHFSRILFKFDVELFADHLLEAGSKSFSISSKYLMFIKHNLKYH